VSAALAYEPSPPPASHLVTYSEVIQGTDEWHDQRRGMVTASAVGRLVTSRSMTATEYPCPACEAPATTPCLSKVKRAGEVGAPIKVAHSERTALAVQMRDQSPRIIEVATGDEVRTLTALLAAERITGHTDHVFVSDDMLRGHEDEPRAIDVYSQHCGVPVESCGFMVCSWGRYRLGYSPDGVIGDDGLVEVKSRRQKKQLLTVVSDEVPPENMAQLQAGLFVSGRDWIDYVSFSGGMHLYVKRVLPDERWFAAIAAAVEGFEDGATAMVAAYEKGTAGMPMTERPAEEMWI
jgi:hypothetical protein